MKNEEVEVEEAQEQDEQQEQEQPVAKERVIELDNPVECTMTVDGRKYGGHVRFERFTFPTWRKWRKTVRNKDYTKKLKQKGYDEDEQAEVVSFWSGAAIISEWTVFYDIVEGREKGTHVEISQPQPGEEPDGDIDYVVFQWFRRVANDYLLPRLGMFPKS